MELKLHHPRLALRPVTANDNELLYQVYSSTRTGELSRVTSWTEEQKQVFLRWQFDAQHQYYQHNYPGAHFWIIEYEGQPIGRLYLHPAYANNSMRIIDIALLPPWRNRGLGRQILLDVMELAQSRGRAVTIHVERFNPAMRLYKSLGFQLVSITNGVYHLLEWKTKKAVLQ